MSNENLSVSQSDLTEAKEVFHALRFAIEQDSIHLSYVAKRVLLNEATILKAWLRSLGVDVWTP